MNDGVDAVLCSLVYTSVDRVAEVAAFLGPGALLAKVDIESAYRLIPVHPEDRPLQAMRWNDRYTSTRCFLLAYTQHQKLLTLSQMLSTGISAIGASCTYSTTWTIS